MAIPFGRPHGAGAHPKRLSAGIALLCLLATGCSVIPQAERQASYRPVWRGAAAPYDQSGGAAYRAAPAYQPPIAGGQCINDLGARAANFTPLPDQFYGAGCSTINTVRLISLSSDDAPLGVSHLGPVTCPLANSFAGWARFGIDRAAREILGSPVARIETMGSYNCRNIAGTAKRSAHSTGNAIDVSGFVLADGRRLTLMTHWSAGTPAERQFLRTVFTSACRRFGTVLGPEYNAAHRDHFHVELSSNGICH
ncbi:extensin [Novosphingobium sp. FSY-8]|uniref:Extensin n=1 Tax=Novosphingobium ovatum TaxID=1908523 RepID=A0ABW9XG41_9SPHN|nr:extensin family protein [Novosphingobium ovatum]NBC37448.1 extensin [Novosphingobium ovatum]